MLIDEAYVHRPYLRGAFCHHYHIGSVKCTLRFAQTAERQKVVVVYRAVPFHEHNRQRRPDITMLECVVKQDEVDSGVDAHHLLDSLAAVLTHGNAHVTAIFLIHLVGFVADIRRGGVLVGHDESACVAFVSSA